MKEIKDLDSIRLTVKIDQDEQDILLNMSTPTEAKDCAYAIKNLKLLQIRWNDKIRAAKASQAAIRRDYLLQISTLLEETAEGAVVTKNTKPKLKFPSKDKREAEVQRLCEEDGHYQELDELLMDIEDYKRRNDVEVDWLGMLWHILKIELEERELGPRDRR